MKRKTIAVDLLLGLAVAAGAREIVRHRRRLDLRGRIVLITGGSRGLGLALAREFAQHGARLALIARDQAELDRAAEDVRRFGSVNTFICDVTDSNAVSATIAKVKEQLGGIDVLVNSAGSIIVGPIEEMTLDDFREEMNTNFWGAVHTIMAAMPDMLQRRQGSIVNIASIGGKFPVPHLAAYSASKFALVGFSGALQAELAKDNIAVTTVDPGLMRTGSPRNAQFKGQNRREYAWFSISDAMPGLSISVERAAKQIVQATREGAAEVILGLPAKFAARLYGLLPGLHPKMASLVAWLLPRPGGIGRQSARGYESESAISQSPLTALGRKAEKEFNQR